MSNPNCGGGSCISGSGEVRVLPLGSGGNAILCRDCYRVEAHWRTLRNTELEEFAKFDIPSWDSLKVYDED